MTKITVNVIKWDKYNPRKDYKTPVWFALSNRVLEDPDLYELDPIEFKSFIYILCQASQRKSATVDLNFAHAERVSNIKAAVLLRTIDKLKELGIVETIQKICTEDDDDLYRRSQASVLHTTRQDTTRHDITNNVDGSPSARFDFEKAFKLYPLKIKGPDAEKRFRNQIVSEQDEADLHAAIANYRAMLTIETWRKPKQTFAAFLGTKVSGYFWRDFITAAPAVDILETKEQRIARLIHEKTQREVGA